MNRGRNQKKFCIATKKWGNSNIRCFATEEEADKYWNKQGTVCSAKGECQSGRCTITDAYISDPCAATKSLIEVIPWGSRLGNFLKCEEDTEYAKNLIISEGPTKEVSR